MATFFGLVPVLAIGFVVVYFAVPGDSYLDFGPLRANTRNLLLGLTFGLALLFLGVGAVHWARKLMDDHEMIDYRHGAASSDDERELHTDRAGQGRRRIQAHQAQGHRTHARCRSGHDLAADARRARRPGPMANQEEARRDHRADHLGAGRPLVNDVTYLPIKARDVEIGQLVNGEPENLQDLEGAEFQVEKAKAAIIVVRMDPNTITIPPSREGWQIGGILCYSKICTHVGCPISLWEQQTHHLLCPCHQSTFDLGDSGVVVFGPANRPLPQLPIAVDSEGYIVARRDFTVPAGPSYSNGTRAMILRNDLRRR